nr:hypothetical protein [uncultured Dyadobacter sp.]
MIKPGSALEVLSIDAYKEYIRVLYLPAGFKLTIDFDKYETDHPALFFIGNNQKVRIDATGSGDVHFIHYNRDFYCIQIHDSEVACDGLLFNNIYNIPMTKLDEKDIRIVDWLFEQMMTELIEKESSQEEMIRIYLKQLIIRATRMWKKQQLASLNDEPTREIEFFRDFSRLVEIHFRSKHSVAAYADILGVAPKTLSANSTDWLSALRTTLLRIEYSWKPSASFATPI